MFYCVFRFLLFDTAASACIVTHGCSKTAVQLVRYFECLGANRQTGFSSRNSERRCRQCLLLPRKLPSSCGKLPFPKGQASPIECATLSMTYMTFQACFHNVHSKLLQGILM